VSWDEERAKRRHVNKAHTVRHKSESIIHGKERGKGRAWGGKGYGVMKRDGKGVEPLLQRGRQGEGLKEAGEV